MDPRSDAEDLRYVAKDPKYANEDFISYILVRRRDMMPRTCDMLPWIRDIMPKT